MGLLDRIAAARSPKTERRYAADQWINDYLIPAAEQSFTYGGASYPYGGVIQTWPGQRIKEISQTLPAYSAALRMCPPAFAAQMKRAMVLSQARFTFRNPPWHPRTPRRTFGTSKLRQLERPWPNATTGELLSRMEWHAGLAGNAYVCRQPNRLRVLRPDFTAILYGSELEPDDPAHALDGEILGYVYQNGGFQSGNEATARTLLPDEVAHWSPIPDPESPGLGMSWVTAALKEIQGDRAATEHKLSFFRNGATANMVVSGIPAMTKDQFNEIVDTMESRHAGVRNAYRTLYLTAGADAKVVGSDLKQLDFKATQGAGETRIALLGGVPAALLGISEGLAGSSLNAGNFGMAKRIFADLWLYPTLQDVAAALAPIVDVPDDAELWFDPADIPLLREDGKDAADIEQVKSATITAYVREGFTAQSAIDAVAGQDVTLLKHTDLVSVQLQPPGATTAPAAAAPPARARAVRKFNPGQPRDPDDGKWVDTTPGDEAIDAAEGVIDAADWLTAEQAEDMRADMLSGDPWTVQQKSALTEYTRGEYGLVNDVLRGHEDISVFMKSARENITRITRDTAAGMRPLPRSVNVTRRVNSDAMGIARPDVDSLSALVGQTRQEPAFMSTTITKDTPRRFGPITLEMHVPAGTPAAYLGGSGGISTASGEAELLLGPGQQYRITDVVQDANGDPKLIVEVL